MIVYALQAGLLALDYVHVHICVSVLTRHAAGCVITINILLGNLVIHVLCWHIHGSWFVIVCVYVHVCIRHVGCLQDGW